MEIDGEDDPTGGYQVSRQLLDFGTQVEFLVRGVLQDGKAVVSHRADAWTVRIDEILVQRGERVLQTGVLEQRLRTLPALRFRRQGDLVDFGWQYPNLIDWASATVLAVRPALAGGTR